jgi:uncharacterized protein involved in exopolysaccharide biosynthesis
MTDSSHLPDGQSVGTDNDEISVFDLLIAIAKHKKVILGLPFVVALVTAGYSLTLPNIYTAITKILPPMQSPSTSAGMAAQLGGLAGALGGAAGLRGPNDVYVAMLKSRTVADKLIERFELAKLYKIDPSHPSDAYKALEGSTKITAGREGLITIEVDDKDPKHAAALANAYVEELLKLTSVMALTQASQRRLFFERQFLQAKENLAKAEAVARQALQTGGLVNVDDQGRAMVEATARLRGQITVKEVQIGAMRAFAAEGNPDLRLAQQELESIKRELARIEGSGTTKAASTKLTGEGLGNLYLLRDVKYYEVIFDLLAKQFEMAKIAEATDAAVMQVMDKAIPPDRKSKPFRAVRVLVATLIAGLAAVLWALVHEWMARARTNPQHAARVQAFKRYLAWSSNPR